MLFKNHWPELALVAEEHKEFEMSSAPSFQPPEEQEAAGLRELVQAQHGS